MARNRYVKVALFTEEKSNLQDSKVVGQGADYLLLERPQPKERVKKERKPRKLTQKVVVNPPTVVA